MLAVCGGYQLLGKYYRTDKKTIEGLGILDITTEWEPERLIPKYCAEQPAFRAAGGGIREPRRADLYRGPYPFWKGVLRAWQYRKIRV